jgi:monoamine oxidase
MISYTDGDDAYNWIQILKKKGIKEVQKQIMSLIRHTFPHRSIPEPNQFKVYPWERGCSYWTSGNYDVTAALEKSYQISPKIYACGESLSHKQAWVESALESATNLLAKL